MNCSFSDLVLSGKTYDTVNCTNNKLCDSQVCSEHINVSINRYGIEKLINKHIIEEEYIDFKNFKYITKYFNHDGCVGEQQLKLYCDTSIDMIPLNKINEHLIKSRKGFTDYRIYNIVSSVVYSIIKNILSEINGLNQLDLIILDYLGYSKYKQHILSYILTNMIVNISELSEPLKYINEHLLPTFIKHEIKYLADILINISHDKFLEFKNNLLNGECEIDKEYSDKMLINLDICINKIEEILRKENKERDE